MTQQDINSFTQNARPNRRPEEGYTLMELIIVTSVILILLLGVALLLDPFERLDRARDTQRLQDFSALDSALKVARHEGGGSFDPDGPFNMDADTACEGEADQRIFVSVPDSEAPPMAPMGWAYAQVSVANLHNIDGTGWLPVDFSAANTAGLGLSALPIDPTNTFASGRYYTYVCGRSGFDYEFTAQMQSVRYGTGGDEDKHAEDGGDDANRYEKGEDLTLTP